MRQSLISFCLFAGLVTLANADPVSDFIKSDINKDKQLQPAEFQTFVKLRAKNGDRGAKWVVRFGAWGRALKAVDSNGDKIVTPAELRAFDAKN